MAKIYKCTVCGNLRESVIEMKPQSCICGCELGPVDQSVIDDEETYNESEEKD